MSVLTYPLNGITYDAEDAETYLCTRTSGVYSEDGHFSASVTGSREITISPGLAWIRNADFHGKCVYNDEPVAVNVPIADGASGRIDRIVLSFDKTANETSIELLQGTPASSPVAPDITQTEELYQLGLYTVNVGASAVSLSDADITSTILDESVCGLMRDGVTQIPTQELYDQYEAVLEDLWQKISDVENDNFVSVTDARSIVELTLTASGWSGTSAPYEQYAIVSGMTAEKVFDVGIIYPENCSNSDRKSISKNSAYIYEIESGSGRVTFRATNKPAVDLTIGLKGVI